MKRAIFSLLVVGFVTTFAFVSCNKSKQPQPVTLATEDRTVTSFNEVILEGYGHLIIKQGDQEALKVVAGEDLIGYILSDVSGERLTIKSDLQGKRQPGQDELEYTLTVNEIEKITIRGAGSVKTQGSVKIDDLDVTIAGVGDADLDVAGDTLEINISGAGRVKAKGEVDTQKITISGAGLYDAPNLLSEDAVIDVSGAGSATVKATDKLDVKISGTGRVFYSGNPKKVTQKITGGGRIKAVEQK